MRNRLGALGLLSLLACFAAMPGDLLAGPPPAASPPGGKPNVLPGYVDQSDGKGGFVAPKAPPPPAPRASAAAPAAPLLPPAKHKFVYVAPVAPPDAKAGHCGIVDTGAGAQVAMDCLDADYDKIDGASQGLIDDDEIGAESLPDRVNHLDDHTEGPVLNQGAAGACTAFSLIAAVNHALAQGTGKPGNVSPMHAWARYFKPKMTAAEAANEGHVLTGNDIFPYDAKTAALWKTGPGPDRSLVEAYDKRPVAKIVDIVQLKRFEDIKIALAKGQDVWFAIRAPQIQQPQLQGKPGSLVVPDYDYHKTANPSSAHALVLAGYYTDKQDTYYLIHNSWGETWGNKGYVYIHESTLKRNMSPLFYTVEAEPVNAPSSATPARARVTVSCAKGLAPDSVSAQCVPLCSDGSPRHHGVCPVANECPKGEVNLRGACVRAAPTLKKRIRFIDMSCAPGGCTYAMAKGSPGCADANGCNLSCAAPAYLLAYSPRGFSCKE